MPSNRAGNILKGFGQGWFGRFKYCSGDLHQIQRSWLRADHWGFLLKQGSKRLLQDVDSNLEPVRWQGNCGGQEVIFPPPCSITQLKLSISAKVKVSGQSASHPPSPLLITQINHADYRTDLGVQFIHMKLNPKLPTSLQNYVPSSFLRCISQAYPILFSVLVPPLPRQKHWDFNQGFFFFFWTTTK